MTLCRQFWRIGNTCSLTFLDLELIYDGVPQNFILIARDDVALGFNGTAKSEMASHWELSPAGRFEIIITGPGINVADATLWTRNRSGNQFVSSPRRPLLRLIPDVNANTPDPVPTTVVNSVTSMRVPTNLLDLTPITTRDIEFQEEPFFAIGPKGNVTAFSQQSYTHPSIYATQGTVEDWIINNPTGTTHHFHIHQMHFLLLEINGETVPSGKAAVLRYYCY